MKVVSNKTCHLFTTAFNTVCTSVGWHLMKYWQISHEKGLAVLLRTLLFPLGIHYAAPKDEVAVKIAELSDASGQAT